MTVDTATLAVVGLEVPRLDLNAEAELRGFVDGVTTTPTTTTSSASTENGNSGLRGNVSVLCWAMNEWLRVAVQRAKVWIVLEREVGTASDGKGVGDLVARMRAAVGRKKRKRRRKRAASAEDEHGDGDSGEGEEDEMEEKYEATELLSFMGRTSMDFEIPVLDGKGSAGEVSALKVQWRVRFDWTGEAKSDIGVLVGVPGKCELPVPSGLVRCSLLMGMTTGHKSDERGRLSGIPGLFDELIQGGEDPLTAVRTVVCLLAGEQK